MTINVTAFDYIASNVGVERYPGEQDVQFCRRVVYSAARFWVEAFCIDDGNDGASGIALQGLNRRVKSWIGNFEKLCPGMQKWFKLEENGPKTLYGRLIDLGDIAPNGFEETYRATPPQILTGTNGVALVTGFYDCSDSQSSVCGFDRTKLITSGLASLCFNNEGKPPSSERWWEADSDYLIWKDARDYEDLLFADPQTHKWSVKHQSIWSESPSWAAGLSLGKVDRELGQTIFFIAKQQRKRLYVCEIPQSRAQSLFFFLRKTVGNAVVVRYERLRSKHFKAMLPIRLIPGRLNRILDATTWPLENIGDFTRVVRVESMPLIRDLLSACYIELEENRYV